MSKETELLPCPFCGSGLYAQWNRANPKARCETVGCMGAKLPILNLDQPDDIAAWNRRDLRQGDAQAALAAKDAEIAALKANRDHWKAIALMYNTKYSEGTVEITALKAERDALRKNRHAREDVMSGLRDDVEALLATLPDELRTVFDSAKAKL